VAQVARLPEPALVATVGQASGRHLHALAHNRDPRPVQHRRRRGSIGSQRARGRRSWTHDSLDADLVGLVDRVTRRMRAADRVGRTVVLRLRFDDYTRATRSLTLRRPTAGTLEILTAARELLVESLPLLRERGVTLVGISVTNLADARMLQLVLPLDEVDRSALDATVDAIRDRFGSQAITRGLLVGRDPGWEMPLLPD
jgi:DNA polymerase-4